MDGRSLSEWHDKACVFSLKCLLVPSASSKTPHINPVVVVLFNAPQETLRLCFQKLSTVMNHITLSCDPNTMPCFQHCCSVSHVFFQYELHTNGERKEAFYMTRARLIRHLRPVFTSHSVVHCRLFAFRQTPVHLEGCTKEDDG